MPVTPPESPTTQAQRLPLLLSFRILYTAVSFGLTLGSDVSAEDIGVSRTSFTFNQLLQLQVTFLHPQLPFLGCESTFLEVYLCSLGLKLYQK